LSELMVVNEVSKGEVALPSQRQTLSGADRYLMSLRSKNSRRTMKSGLNRIAKMLGYDSYKSVSFQDMKSSDVDMLIEVMRVKDKLNPNTINLYIAGLKGVFKHCWKASLMPYEEYLKLKSTKELSSKRVKRDRVIVKKNVISDIINHCVSAGDNRGIRDASMIALLSGCGLRRDEIASLNLKDYVASKGRMYVTGKGDKERATRLTQTAVEHLNRWLTVRGHEDGALFPKVHKSGSIDKSLGNITGQAIYNMLDSRCSEMGIEHIHPHAIRHFYGTTLLRSGVDIVTVRDMLGHESIATTQTYIDEDESVQEEAVKHLEI